MRESSVIPTNLLNWPRVADRLPEEKLILLALWSAPWLSSAGCGELPLRPFAASVGLDAASAATGINNLREVGLIVIDEDTNELFVMDWFRFHKFKSSHSQNILRGEIEKVRSEALKNVIRLKSTICLPTTTATATEKINPNLNPPPPPSGVPPEGAGDNEINLNQSQSQGQSQTRLGNEANQSQSQSRSLALTNSIPGIPRIEKKKGVLDVEVPDWIPKDDWQAFVDHRRAIRKPLTLDAANRLIKELERLRSLGNDVAAVINQTIVSRWAGVFPVRNGSVSQVPESRQRVRDVLSSMHHDFHLKDYSAGVDKDGRLID